LDTYRYNASSKFTGTLNGNGHTISNLWINRPNDCDIGLFGFIKGGRIEKLGVKIADSGVIGQCNVGGIAGRITDLGKIILSYSKRGVIQAKSGNTGGIVGYANGGFVLYSYSEGNVIGTTDVGGIVGRVNADQISYSYSTASINGYDYVGGIAGFAKQSAVTNNAAINPLVDGSFDVNRVIGYDTNALTTLNNFALNTMMVSGTVIDDVGGLDGAGKKVDEFKLKATYLNGLDWYFGGRNIVIIGIGDKAWVIPANSYPKLYWE
jgi:hypothetical protein